MLKIWYAKNLVCYKTGMLQTGMLQKRWSAAVRPAGADGRADGRWGRGLGPVIGYGPKAIFFLVTLAMVPKL